MKKLIKNIVLLVNIAAAILLIASYLSTHISPKDLWILSIIGLAYPYILLANILLILYWLINTSKYVLLSIVSIIIGYSHLQNYIQFSSNTTEEEGLKIYSYNLKRFAEKGYYNSSENATDIFSFLQEEDPDIICLQEVNFSKEVGFEPSRIKSSLQDIESMQYAHTSRDGGPLTLSKFPIVYLGEIRFESSGNMIIYSDINVDGDTIRVYNCHLQSYRFTPNDINSIDSLSFENSDKNIEGIKVVSYKLKQAFIKRSEQADKLNEHINKSPYPVIVCGDFNDTPVSYTYQTVRGNLNDAFVESGSGIGNTYIGKLPSFRIDYIFFSDHFKGYNFKVDEVDFSDHYPVSCTLLKE